MSRKTTPYVVETDRLQLDGSEPEQVIAVGSAAWLAWLAEHDRFTFQHQGVRFTARREERRGGHYWYAYRRHQGQLHKVYLGRATDVTVAALIAAGERLDGGPAGDATPPAEGQAADAAPLPPRPAPDAVPRVVLNWLTPPALPEHLIARPRLARLLDRPIVLVSAPSGYGKTTLLNQWQATLDHPMIWVSLNGEDNTAYTFWSAVLLAWQKIEPAHEVPLALLRSSDPPEMASLLLLILDSLHEAQSEHAGRKVTVIIDNYQRAQAPPLDTSLQLFLDHLPPGLQMVLASRELLPFETQRWRGKGLVAEVTQDDLRLTPEEGLTYLERLSPRTLTEREKVSLVVRAGGWPAGLNLLLLALRQQGNVHAYVATFNGHDRYLHNYVAGEILARHSPERQDFLLKTSLLKILSGPLCNALTGGGDGDDMLAHLHQANEFVSLVDEAHGWYQYHDLFANALQDELSRRYPALLPELHHRAAAWLLENNLFPEAMRHLLRGGEWSEAVHLIDRAILAELRRGSDHRVLRWMQQLPGELFMHHPCLPITYARLAHNSIPAEQIEERLDHFVTLVAARPEEKRTAAQRATLAWVLERRQTGRWPAVDGDARVGETLGLEMTALWRIFDLRESAWRRLREGDEAGSTRLLEEAVHLAQLEGLAFLVVMIQSNLVSLATRHGRLAAAETLIHSAFRWLRSARGVIPECASVLETSLARIYLARNQLAQARAALDRAAAVDPYPTSLNVPILSHVLQAHLLNAQGDGVGARVAIQAARDLEPFSTRILSPRDVQLHEALILLQQGDVAAAEQLLHVDLAAADPDRPDTILYGVVMAQFYLQQGNYAAAELALGQVVGARADPLLIATFLPPLLLAWSYWEQDKTHQARHELLQAVRATEAEGILRPFLTCGPRLIPLLTFAAQSVSSSPGQRRFIESALAGLRVMQPDGPDLSPADFERRSVAAAISPREQELLRVLAMGMTNREIAGWLVLEESTIATHLRNIYRKLDVNSRVQAIRRAREIGLI